MLNILPPSKINVDEMKMEIGKLMSCLSSLPISKKKLYGVYFTLD